MSRFFKRIKTPIFGVRNGRIQPEDDPLEIVSGGSGDSMIIRCRQFADESNPGWYYAQALPGEKIKTGYRRVQNWCTERDIYNWGKSKSGAAALPVVENKWYIGPDRTYSARKVIFDMGGGTTATDAAYVVFAVSGDISVTRAASVWVKSAVSGVRQTFQLTCGSDPRSITVGDDWVRVASMLQTPWSSPRIVIALKGDMAPSAEILIATDPEHCPQLEIGIPPEQKAPSEVVAPDVVYNAGVPGVRYFDDECDLEVDPATGVVYSTGRRRVFPVKFGLTVPGAATIRGPSYPDNIGTAPWWNANGTKPVSVSAASANLGLFIASVVTPYESAPSGSGVVYSRAGATIPAGQSFTMIAAVGKNQGNFRIGHSNGVGDRVNYTLNTSDGSLTDPLVDNPVNFVEVLDCGNFWVFALSIVKQDNGGLQKEIFNISRADTDPSPFTVGGVQVYDGIVPPSMLMQQNAASALSRPPTIARWKDHHLTDLWQTHESIRVRFELDGSNGLQPGVLLSGRSVDGARSEALVELVDPGDGTLRVQVHDGVDTWLTPLAVSSAETAVVSVSIPSHGHVMVSNGTDTYSAPARLAWASELYVGSMPDGTKSIGVPMNVLPGEYA